MGSHTLTLNLVSMMILFLQLGLLVTFSMSSGQTRHMKNISENGFGPALMKMMEGHLPMSPIMFKEGTVCSNCDNCKHCHHCQNCENGALCDQQCGNTDFHDGSTNG